MIFVSIIDTTNPANYVAKATLGVVGRDASARH
jgi:hypothetical protein